MRINIFGGQGAEYFTQARVFESEALVRLCGNSVFEKIVKDCGADEDESND